MQTKMKSGNEHQKVAGVFLLMSVVRLHYYRVGGPPSIYPKLGTIFQSTRGSS